MAKTDWKIEEERTGWSVFRRGRVVEYDLADEDTALARVRRKDGKGVKVTIVELMGDRRTRTT